MTKKALIELVQRRLKFIDSKKQFPTLYVQGAMDIAWQELCSQGFNDKKFDPHFYTKKYTPVTVIEDIDSELYYSDLPAEIINLPRIGEGVISINQIDSRSSDFKPIRQKDFRLLTTQEIFRIGGDIYYYVDYDRVYYGASMTNDIVSSGVEMHLCVPFSVYEFDELLPIPSGLSNAFMELAINYLAQTPVVNTDNKNEA